MTLNEFVQKYKGKFVEANGNIQGQGAFNQCVDLANQYISEVISLPKILWTNAQDFPSKAGNNYDYILNTPTGVPIAGDIMIWKSADKVGHIAIFISGDEFTFTSFDQNWPTGSPCSLVKHSYTNVLGWLHPKVSIIEDSMNDLQTVLDYYHVKTKDELIKMVDEQIAFLTSERKDNDGLKETIKNLQASHKDFVENLLKTLNPLGNPLGLSDEELVKKLAVEAVKAESDLQSQVKQIEADNEVKQQALEKENADLKDELSRLQNEFSAMQVKHKAEIESFQSKLDNVQAQFDANKKEVVKVDYLQNLVDAIIKIFERKK